MGRYRTPGLFLLLAAVWGTAFPATDAGLADIPPVLFAAVRFDVAAVLLFAYVFVTDTDWRPRGREDYAYVAIGGTFAIAAHHAFLFAGQQYVTGGVAAVLLGLVPVITPALTRVVSPGEEFTPRTAVGVALGFLGVAVIATLDAGVGEAVAAGRCHAGVEAGVGVAVIAVVALLAGLDDAVATAHRRAGVGAAVGVDAVGVVSFLS
jgi:drug/metabolite transporter (DMT)-like permease